MSLKPLGIFWDINDCGIPLTTTINECITQLRHFISDKYNNNCIEYQFSCVCDSQLLNQSMTQSLNQNGCDILHINGNNESNICQKFYEIIEKFVDHYGFDSVVVIITSNTYLCSSIRSAKRKEVEVLLIYGNNSSQSLISSANLSIPFNDVFGFNRTVILSITNLPQNKSRKVIREAFNPFCQQFNCKFRFQKKELVKLEFNNTIDAKRAEDKLNELEFFGHELGVEYEEYDSQNESSNTSLMSTESRTIPPQNDDKCKSVIIGLLSKKNQNVLQMVRNIVKGWNDFDVYENMIVRVNRERDFIGRDGKASLIVTAINQTANEKLLSVAKNRFVNREEKLYWNRLRRSKKDFDSNESDVVYSKEDLHIDNIDSVRSCRSRVIGLWTRHDENVLKLIRNLVKSWNIYDFDIKHIIGVERAKKFYQKDGKASLVVITDTPQTNKKLLTSAYIKFNNKNHKYYWIPLVDT